MANEVFKVTHALETGETPRLCCECRHWRKKSVAKYDRCAKLAPPVPPANLIRGTAGEDVDNMNFCEQMRTYPDKCSINGNWWEPAPRQPEKQEPVVPRPRWWKLTWA